LSDGERGQTWELAKLIGRYETFTEGVDRRLDKIEEHLENGSKSFTEIQNIIAEKREQIDNIETRVKHFENNGFSKRRRLQIDGTTIAAIVLALKEVVNAIVGALH